MSALGGEKPMILVTGASGYIACHVVKALNSAGYKVRGTLRSVENDRKVKLIYDLGTKENPIDLCEADLTDESSWLPAVNGCEYVLHIASPVPQANPKHEDEIIKPAVSGTLAVLKACRDDGGVKRVILTSSIAAVNRNFLVRKAPWTEQDWTNTDGLSGPRYCYIKSKTLAERAAWDFIKKLPEDKKFELAVVNPGFVIGPALCGSLPTIMEIPRRLMQSETSVIPKLGLPIVDVRDVALAHVIAMTLPEAAGNRHILVTKTLWVKEIAMILKEEFEPQGYNIPTTEIPSFLTRIASWFDPVLKMVTAGLDQFPKFDSMRMTYILGVKARRNKAALLDMTYWMIEEGHIKKTDKYTGPKYRMA